MLILWTAVPTYEFVLAASKEIWVDEKGEGVSADFADFRGSGEKEAGKIWFDEFAARRRNRHARRVFSPGWGRLRDGGERGAGK
jgi:hypothetical protein